MVSVRPRQASVGRVLYGLLFVVLIPLLLTLCTVRLDQVVDLPIPPWHAAGFILFVGALLLIALAMRDLYVRGHGLPMNAYPPQVFVTQGAYAWFTHPIYLGAVVACLGASLWTNSSAGLYIMTPVLALACIALVLGYERQALRRLFGDQVEQSHPLFRIPQSLDTPVTLSRKTAMVVRVFAPALLGAYLIDYAKCGSVCANDAVLMLAHGWPSLVGLVWTLPFIALAIAFFLTRSEAGLRNLVIVGSLATAGFLFLQLIAPTWLGQMPTSIPMLTAASVALIGVSLAYKVIWRGMQKACQWVSNSRRDWLFFDGRFRIISHSLYSGLGGVIGAAVIGYVTGVAWIGPVLIVFILAGAALYAQISWGSNALLRPFGFWGGGAGALVGVLVLWLALDIPVSLLVLAVIVAAPFAQAAGRLRCMVQGCCHGIETDERYGIRVWNPQSRVCLLSGLKGQPILMTQMYSILFNLLLGALLVALWQSEQIPVAVIAAAYLTLTSIERFAEDAYRGEKQTRVILGLKEPQWIALGGLAAGLLTIFLPWSYIAAGSGAGGSAMPWLVAGALAGGLIGAFAMSMDFPKSKVRFSRLSG
jgi:protein-S-isoprenylcysteine O-methyltransferase Ste14